MKRRSFLHLSASALAACAMPRPKTRAPDDPRPRPCVPRSSHGSATSSRSSFTSASTPSPIASGATAGRSRHLRPAQLDARQWARAARAAGARGDPHGEASRRLLSLAHATTEHSVAKSPWRDPARATSFANSSTPAAPRGCGPDSISRRGIATTRSTAIRRGTTISIATSSPSCSLATDRSPRCGSTARMAKGRTESGRRTTGRGCSLSSAGFSRTR